MAKQIPVKKLNLSKATDIQPETLLKTNYFIAGISQGFCLEHFPVAPSVPNNLTNLVS